MTLDLYYSNFTNVGDALEKMYETFLVGDIKVVTRNNTAESNINAAKATENGKVQASLERLSVTKKAEEQRKSTVQRKSTASPARSLTVQIRNTQYVKNGPASPSTNFPRSPQKTSPPSRVVHHSSSYRSVSQSRGAPQSPKPSSNRSLSQTPTYRGPPQSPTTRNAPHYTSNRSASQTPPARRAPQSSTSQNSPHHSSNRSVSQTPPNRNNPMFQSMRNAPKHESNLDVQQFSKKKTSPQDLRSKKSPPMTNGNNALHDQSDKGEHRAIEKPIETSTNSHDNENAPPTSSDSSTQNATDENVLRQQNSRSSTPSSTATQTKYKVNSKVYFREENVENLTWNGETSFEGDPDDPEESTSPKVNPYSSSFLNFLKTN